MVQIANNLFEFLALSLVVYSDLQGSNLKLCATVPENRWGAHRSQTTSSAGNHGKDCLSGNS
jgi:hypothetical protein